MFEIKEQKYLNNHDAQMDGLLHVSYIKIAWFSCGITSAVACKLALEKYSNVELYYIEIKSAHPDNERFILDCEKWYGKKINRIKSNKFNDQFEVIEKIRYINGVAGASCTKELKKGPRFEIESKLNIENQIFGFEYSKNEKNRAKRFSEQYPYTNPLFPLIENKLSKNECAGILQKQGIKLPAMYLLGYNNNNCIGCVKGGKGYWNKIKIDFPKTFERMASLERKLKHSCINGKFLDELQPDEGDELEYVMPDCGLFCDVEFAHLIDKEIALEFSNCG